MTDREKANQSTSSLASSHEWWRQVTSIVWVNAGTNFDKWRKQEIIIVWVEVGTNLGKSMEAKVVLTK